MYARMAVDRVKTLYHLTPRGWITVSTDSMWRDSTVEPRYTYSAKVSGEILLRLACAKSTQRLSAVCVIVKIQFASSNPTPFSLPAF